MTRFMAFFGSAQVRAQVDAQLRTAAFSMLTLLRLSQKLFPLSTHHSFSV